MRFWDFDHTTQWLSPVDAFCATEFVERAVELRGGAAVLETGVWHGAWISQMVLGRPGVRGVGVDPYPNLERVREGTVERFNRRGLDQAVSLVDSLDDVDAAMAELDIARFDVAHIDGDHSEEATTADLHFADRHLADDGVIIVDDYRHPYFPGLANAMFTFLRSHQYAIFLTTGQKAYLCREHRHEEQLAETERSLRSAGIAAVRNRPAMGALPYVSKPDVMGRPLVLALREEDNLRLVAPFASEAGSSSPEAAARVRAVMARWLPKQIVGRMRTQSDAGSPRSE